MSFRIYVDESGTQSDQWLIIGMLFVPTHGVLHSALCKVKDRHAYFNASPKYSSKYKETHLTKFRSDRDATVAKEWIDAFVAHDCYFRAVVVDWSIWDGSYFGTPFEPAALQKRRAYKKWAEMLLHPELKDPQGGRPITRAKLYLDRLRIMYGYDVLAHLRARDLQQTIAEPRRTSQSFSILIPGGMRTNVCSFAIFSPEGSTSRWCLLRMSTNLQQRRTWEMR